MKNIVIGLLAFLLAQNYIEVDGKKTYLRSMTPQEISESERRLKEQEPKPETKIQVPIVKEPISRPSTPIVIFQQPNPLVDPQYFDRSIRIRIENRRQHDKEYYESTGRGTLKKVEIDNGKRVEESWKMEGNNLVKERKETKP